jgi:hypothetical protein
LIREGREFTVDLDRLSVASRQLALRLASADQRNLGEKVLAFCEQRIGRKVGDGECATLAAEALAAAGAMRMGRDFPNPGDYVWGRQVALLEAGRKGVTGSLDKVKPGDIIQFRDARFEGVNRNGGGTYWMTATHHTAVVVTVGKQTLIVCHQNWGKKIVKKDTLYPADLRKGWLRFYRPVPGS